MEATATANAVVEEDPIFDGFDFRESSNNCPMFSRVNTVKDEIKFDGFFILYSGSLVDKSEKILTEKPEFLDNFDIRFSNYELTDKTLIHLVDDIRKTATAKNMETINWFILSLLRLDLSITDDQYSKYVSLIMGIKIINMPDSKIEAFQKELISIHDDLQKCIDIMNLISEKEENDIDLDGEEEDEEEDKIISIVEESPEADVKYPKVIDGVGKFVNEKKDEVKKEINKFGTKKEEPKKEEKAFHSVTEIMDGLLGDITKDLTVSYDKVDDQEDMIIMNIFDKDNRNSPITCSYYIDRGTVIGNGYNLLLPFINTNGQPDTVLINIYRHKDIINKILHNPKYPLTQEEFAAVNKDMLPNQYIYRFIDFSGMKKYIINMSDENKAALSTILTDIIKPGNWGTPQGYIALCRMRFASYTDTKNFVLVSDEKVKIQIPQTMCITIHPGTKVVVKDNTISITR